MIFFKLLSILIYPPEFSFPLPFLPSLRAAAYLSVFLPNILCFHLFSILRVEAGRLPEETGPFLSKADRQHFNPGAKGELLTPSASA